MDKLKTIIRLYNETHRVAFLYPKLKKISLNGGMLLNYREAIEAMIRVIPENELEKNNL